MCYKLFLDDERYPTTDDWMIARSFAEAESLVWAWGIPAFVSFDHDLGDGPSGQDFAQWLGEYILDQGKMFDPDAFDFYVHSQNPVGAERIRGYMNGLLQFIREERKSVGDNGKAEGITSDSP